jgi:hypothetical protein
MRARVSSGSEWSHVGLVVRGEAEAHSPRFAKDYVEVENSSAALCVFEAVPRRGVSLFPLKDRLARTIGTIKKLAVRRRQGPELSASAEAQLMAFVTEVLGRKLEFASFDMITAINPWHSGNQQENWDAFFCSELVAEGLQQLGVLREEGVNSNNVLPRSFDKRSDFLNSHCLEGHSFADEEVLIDAPGAEGQWGFMCVARKRTGHGLVNELKKHKHDSKQRLLSKKKPAS